MSILKKLTENVVRKDVSKETAMLVSKWEQTGLLDGLKDEHSKDGMAILLENQAKQLLKEVSAMSQGDVEGFAAVAFPIVRRVFGNLIANELVSVQPMSLPSGLIFFLDFIFTDTRTNTGATATRSMYGGNVVGNQLTGGVRLEGRGTTGDFVWNSERSFYSLNNGFSSPTGSTYISTALDYVAARSGSNHAWATTLRFTNAVLGYSITAPPAYLALGDGLVNFDPELSGSNIVVFRVPRATFTGLNRRNYITLDHHADLTGAMSKYSLVRRLTREDPVSGSAFLLLTFATYSSGTVDTSDNGIGCSLTGAGDGSTTGLFTWCVSDGFTAGGALGSVVGTTPWGLEGTSGTLTGTGTNTDIPEIEVKVDSLSVTAITKKLKAKWTPELGQDLNAYHNLDAEVELTSVLSEQIALEIDREILNDLINGATAGRYFWSRHPGKFLDRNDGHDITAQGSLLPTFTGNVSMWYETLLEVINDISAQIHRKTLRGGANFIVTSPEVCSILEMTSGFRASVAVDDEKGTAGVINAGSISKKWDVYVDPYFVRNIILVGRKGKSFLESGFVYAPYVPLQVTPTIFGVEDFVPRKGVMTRYAKSLVKGDMYGLVVVADLF